MNVCGTLFGSVIRIHSLTVSIHFCIYSVLRAGEGSESVALVFGNKYNNTSVNINLYVLGPEVIFLPEGLSGITVKRDISIKVYYSDRKRGYCLHAGLIVLTGACNGNSCCISLFIDHIGCGKSCRKHHMVKLPMVGRIQVNIKRDLLNSLNHCSVKIYPVNRSAKESVKSRIFRNHLNSRACIVGFHVEYTNNNRLVTHIIANFKLHTMCSVCKSNIVENELSIGVLNINLNTVNISLCSACIKSGSILLAHILGYRGLYCNDIIRDGRHLSLCQRIFLFSAVQSNLSKDGRFSVVCRSGVVNDDIVNVDRALTVRRAGLLEERVRAAVLAKDLNKRTLNTNTFIITYVNREVVPSGVLKNLVYIAACKNSNLVCNRVTAISVLSVIIKLEPEIIEIVRNINPCADRGCVIDIEA